VRGGAIGRGVCEEAQLRLFLLFAGCSMCEVGIGSVGGGVGEVVLQARTQEFLKLRVWCGARRGCGRAEVLATDAGVLSARDTGRAPGALPFGMGRCRHGADGADQSRALKRRYQEKKLGSPNRLSFREIDRC
jgi:hypothetical protein